MTKLTENLVQQRLKTCTTDLDKVQQINVTGRELKDVSLLRKMTGVEILSLSVNQIASLADFQDCKNLRELYLRQNKISDLNEIFYLKNLPKLELLMLSQNPCVDDPLYRMTVIKNLKNLTELDGITITPEEKRQAQKIGEEVYINIDLLDPNENCIPDGPQIQRTPPASNQQLKPSGETETIPSEANICKEVEEHEVEEIIRKTNLEEGSIKFTSSSVHSNPKKVKQSPKPKKKAIPTPTTETVLMNPPLCKLCGNCGPESSHIIGIPKNSNILSATLSLLKELDYPGLQVINAEVCSRMNAFEVGFICSRQTITSRNTVMKEAYD